jgi:hypothetical protein
VSAPPPPPPPARDDDASVLVQHVHGRARQLLDGVLPVLVDHRPQGYFDAA